MNDKYNPFEDKSLHITKTDDHHEPIEERKGFNDVMEHYNAINGHQFPKKIEHFPKGIRKIVRWMIIIGVTIFLLYQIYYLYTLIVQEV